MSAVIYNATVKKIGQPVPSKFDQRLRKPIEFSDDRGNTFQMWEYVSNMMFNSLQIGQKVEIQQNGEKREILNVPDYTPNQQQPQPTMMNTAQATNPKDDIIRAARRFEMIFSQVKGKFQEHDLDDEHLRCISTSIYIDISKKHPI